MREYRRVNQKWRIQRNWQHRVHNTKKKTTQNVLDTTTGKKTTQIAQIRHEPFYKQHKYTLYINFNQTHVEFTYHHIINYLCMTISTVTCLFLFYTHSFLITGLFARSVSVRNDCTFPSSSNKTKETVTKTQVS